MSGTTLTKKALRLRLQAARMAERELPDQVRRAYGEMPDQLADLPVDDPLLVGTRERAQASLVNRGLLTHVELSTLSVAEAASLASRRLHDEIESLQAEQAKRPSTSDSFGKAPRTLRR